MTTPSADDLLKTLQDLRAVQGAALIIGGIAVGYYGHERLTKVIDILYSEHGDTKILQRLDAKFKIVLKSESGWHHLEHRLTGVRLELIPGGGLTTYGFIPGPKTAGGRNGFISLAGLIWLKLVSGRIQDEADVVALAKLHPSNLSDIRSALPSELRERFDAMIGRAQLELANDPHRLPETRKGKATPKKPRKKK